MTTPEEARERQTLLTTTLRSGEYTQGRNRLRTHDCFCCLGVACDIYMKQTGQGEWKEVHVFDAAVPGRYAFYHPAVSKGEEHLLPAVIQEWFGLPQLFKLNDEFNTLSSLNDVGPDEDTNNPLSFPEIADVIENNIDLSIKELLET